MYFSLLPPRSDVWLTNFILSCFSFRRFLLILIIFFSFRISKLLLFSPYQSDSIPFPCRSTQFTAGFVDLSSVCHSMDIRHFRFYSSREISMENHARILLNNNSASNIYNLRIQQNVKAPISIFSPSPRHHFLINSVNIV